MSPTNLLPWWASDCGASCRISSKTPFRLALKRTWACHHMLSMSDVHHMIGLLTVWSRTRDSSWAQAQFPGLAWWSAAEPCASRRWAVAAEACAGTSCGAISPPACDACVCVAASCKDVDAFVVEAVGSVSGTTGLAEAWWPLPATLLGRWKGLPLACPLILHNLHTRTCTHTCTQLCNVSASRRDFSSEVLAGGGCGETGRSTQGLGQCQKRGLKRRCTHHADFELFFPPPGLRPAVVVCW